jgi:hypothetical protein
LIADIRLCVVCGRAYALSPAKRFIAESPHATATTQEKIMAAPQRVTKEEILNQLRKEGVQDLNGLADLVVRKAHQDGDPNKPVANSVIVYNHGFVTS